MGYEKPQITEVGSVADLTLGNSNKGPGNNSGRGRGRPNHGVS